MSELVDPDVGQIRMSPTYVESFVGSPLVTVCIPTYNRGELLCERTLPSVISQTYGNWEAIVVGDGCTDDTAERIEALGEKRIRFFNRSVNGPYPTDPLARRHVAGTFPANESLERARGRWIAPLDDDDEWTSDHLENLLNIAFRQRAELIYGRLSVAIDGAIMTWLGNWPPQLGDFALGGAIYHADLRGFRYDISAWERGQPGDWDLAQRMLDAGVIFAFSEKIVGTYNAPRSKAMFWADVATRRGVDPKESAGP